MKPTFGASPKTKKTNVMYAICRVLKMKNTTDISASDNHCMRVDGRGTEDSHIDTELSQHNVYSQNYHREDGSAMGLNEALETAIQNYEIKVPRKDSVKVVEFMFTLSPEYFEGVNVSDGLNDPKIKAFYRSASDFLGRENDIVLDFHLHLDETTPHIHAHVIMTDTNKKGECILNASKKLDGRKKLSALQDRYFDSMKRHVPGLKRGIPSEITNAKHMTLKQIRKSLQALIKTGLSNEIINHVARELVVNPSLGIEKAIEIAKGKPAQHDQRAEELKQNPLKVNDKGFSKDL